MRLVEIFEDGERLEQHRAVVLDQRRQRHHRIDLAEGVLALLALHQIDVDHLVGRDALEIERDAHAERRQRAPERKEFHNRLPTFYARSNRPSCANRRRRRCRAWWRPRSRRARPWWRSCRHPATRRLQSWYAGP